LGRPQNQSVCFLLTFQRAVAGGTSAISVIRGLVIGGEVGQLVTLRAASGETRTTTLDEHSRYEFSGLSAGIYAIEVAGRQLSGLYVDGSSTLEVPPLDIRPRQSTISGTVRDATNAPRPGVLVTITSIETRQETVTDGQGAYRFTGLLPGRYTVEVMGIIRQATVDGLSSATLDFILPGTPAGKVITCYLLFGPPTLTGTRTNLILAEDYIMKFRPVVGFSVDEAVYAQKVIIVGGSDAVSTEDEARLRASGTEVLRLDGDPYAIEKAFTRLVQEG